MRRGPLLAVVSSCLGLAACATSPPEEMLYVALGASDAVGIGAFPLNAGYVYLIEDALEEQIEDVELINLGIPAADVAVIERAAEVFLATGNEPDLVTLWTGPNDVIRGDDPDDFEGDLADILEQLRDETDALVVMANLPDLTQLPRFRQEPDPDVTEERIEAFNAAIERQADEFDVLLVDFHGQAIEDDLVSGVDRFHPDTEGHRAIAHEFLEIILPSFGLEPVS